MGHRQAGAPCPRAEALAETSPGVGARFSLGDALVWDIHEVSLIVYVCV
jgi:hypothetical protein